MSVASGLSLQYSSTALINSSIFARLLILSSESSAYASEKVYQILKDAKVNYVSELVNKPVEVTIDKNCFKDFRILTEVL